MRGIGIEYHFVGLITSTVNSASVNAQERDKSSSFSRDKASRLPADETGFGALGVGYSDDQQWREPARNPKSRGPDHCFAITVARITRLFTRKATPGLNAGKPASTLAQVRPLSLEWN